MTNLFNTNLGKHFFAVICTILFSTTVLLSATAPALAGETVATPPVVAPLA